MAERDPRIHLPDSLPPGRDYQVTTCVADLRQEPGDLPQKMPRESQLYYGEVFTVYEEKDGYVWGQNTTDQYIGYVCTEFLSPDIHTPTHCLSALRASVYPEPDIKTLPCGRLGFMAQLSVTEEKNGFAQLKRGGWVRIDQIAPLDQTDPDFVKTAEQFLGVPYLWAGRGGDALDCAALIQLCLARAGLSVPRDTDLQRDVIGTEAKAPWRRGDIVYFKGHVGIMIDESRLINANSHYMQVTINPLDEVSGWYGGITTVRRI